MLLQKYLLVLISLCIHASLSIGGNARSKGTYFYFLQNTVFSKAVTSFHTNSKSVSGSACKELGSHHSTLADWKTNNSSEIPKGGRDIGQTAAPKIGATVSGSRDSQVATSWEPVLREEPWDCNSQSPGGCVWTSLRVTSPVTGVSHTFVSFTPGAQSGSHGRYWRRISSYFWQRNHFRNTPDILCFLTRPVLSRNSSTRN